MSEIGPGLHAYAPTVTGGGGGPAAGSNTTALVDPALALSQRLAQSGVSLTSGASVAQGALTQRAAQTPALAVAAPTVVAVPATVAQTPGLALSPVLAQSGTSQTPALNMVQVTFALTSTKGAATATAGGSGWTNATNAQGTHDGTSASFTGNAVSAREGSVTMTYANYTAKTDLTISSVTLILYLNVTGIVAGNGVSAFSYDIGAGPVTLETFTANADHSAGKSYDITSAIAGSWTNLDALTTIVYGQADAVTGATRADSLDAVEVVVVASVTDTL